MKRKHTEVLALIPARGGSQRVKNKNALKLQGKPLLAYTIEAALKASQVTRVIVTTDDPKLERIAKRFGAEVPFLRPKSISGPHSTEFEFHMHALKWLKENEGYSPDLIVNLYPTSPFRKSVTIDRAVQKIKTHPEAHSLRSVRKCSEHPYKMWIRAKNKEYLTPFVAIQKKGSQTLSYQLLPEVFIQNASIYITRPETLKREGSTTGTRVLFFEMSEIESIDINTPLDYDFARNFVKKLGR